MFSFEMGILQIDHGVPTEPLCPDTINARELSGLGRSFSGIPELFKLAGLGMLKKSCYADTAPPNISAEPLYA